MIRSTALLALLSLSVAAQEGKASLTTDKSADALIVKGAGRELLRYQLQKPSGSLLAVESACYFHPLTTPKGTVVTDVAPDDHRHHRGIFLGWVEMHGKKDADFWGWGKYAPTERRVIVNKESAQRAEGDTATIHVKNEWRAEDVAIVQEDLHATFRAQAAANVLDLVYTLTADADVKLARWAFGGFCLRVRKDKDSKVETLGPDGPVKLPAPNHMKPETDWPAAPWYGCTVTLPDGTVLAAAVIDHPKNPPALWHNAMSIRMINPCIVAPNEVVIRVGEPLVLRYRVVAQDGALSRDHVNQLAKDWTK